MAVATPLAHNHLHKKEYVYDVVTDVVYVTVTEGEIPETPTTVHILHTVIVNPVEAVESTTSSHVHKSKTTTSSTPTPPAPAPTTSTTPPPAPTTTTEAAPVETTTQAPVEVAATTSAVEVAAAVSSTAAAASSTPASSDTLAGTGVDNHNTCRSSHSAENVAWNETLASYAAKTAATCVFAHDM